MIYEASLKVGLVISAFFFLGKGAIEPVNIAYLLTCRQDGRAAAPFFTAFKDQKSFKGVMPRWLYNNRS